MSEEQLELVNARHKVEELKQLINDALDQLYEKEKELLDLSGNEMSLAFRFGIYSQELVKLSQFSNLNVDCEYNKNGTKSKIIPERTHGVRPDLILHKRRSHNAQSKNS